MHVTRPFKVLKTYDAYSAIHPPLTARWRNVPSGGYRWEEAVSQAFGHKAFLLFTGVNRSLHCLGKWWTEFRTDEFWFRSIIAFTICLSQFRLTKNGRESQKLIFKKGLKTWNPNFRRSFQPGNRECLFRRSVCFRNFPLKRRKQPESELMVSLAKHQSVFLACFNGSHIESCSSFTIHTRSTSIWAPLWHPRSFFSVLSAGKGKNFEKNYCTNT